MMPGGRTKLNGEYVGVDKVFMFDIETRTWSEDGEHLSA